MTQAALVDDALVARLAVGGRAALPAALDGRVLYTTGLWYFRLSRAVLSAEEKGALSRLIAGVPLEARFELLARVPDLAEVVSLNELAPAAGAISVQAAERGARLNALSAEALAAALDLGAELFVTVDYPHLRAMAGDTGTSFTVLEG